MDVNKPNAYSFRSIIYFSDTLSRQLAGHILFCLDTFLRFCLFGPDLPPDHFTIEAQRLMKKLGFHPEIHADPAAVAHILDNLPASMGLPIPYTYDFYAISQHHAPCYQHYLIESFVQGWRPGVNHIISWLKAPMTDQKHIDTLLMAPPKLDTGCWKSGNRALLQSVLKAMGESLEESLKDHSMPYPQWPPKPQCPPCPQSRVLPLELVDRVLALRRALCTERLVMEYMDVAWELHRKLCHDMVIPASTVDRLRELASGVHRAIYPMWRGTYWGPDETTRLHKGLVPEILQRKGFHRWLCVLHLMVQQHTLPPLYNPERSLYNHMLSNALVNGIEYLWAFTKPDFDPYEWITNKPQSSVAPIFSLDSDGQLAQTDFAILFQKVASAHQYGLCVLPQSPMYKYVLENYRRLCFVEAPSL
jgi:hypothetical protein